MGGRPQRRRDAERRWRGGGASRRAAGRSHGHDVHGVAGPAPDDPGHVQDRGRADAVRDARRRAHPRDARVVHLRRPQRRDGRTDDGVRDARLVVRAGSPRPGARRARGDARGARPVPALLRRVQDVARGGQDRDAGSDGPARDDRRPAGARAPCPGALPRPSRPPRIRAEPRRVLPGARGGEPVPRRGPGHRAADDGSPRRPQRSSVPALRLRRRPGGRACRRADGLGVRRRRGGGGGADPPGRAGGHGQGSAVPAVLRRGVRRGPADHGALGRRPRSHEGARRAGRAALSGRRDGAGRRGRAKAAPASTAACRA